ncbi:MAG: hypothetical protein FWC56_04250, partial [Phycisphaerae bacterium]|nr:hypothetical protein [Phycisphaerae bacterium]
QLLAATMVLVSAVALLAAPPAKQTTKQKQSADSASSASPAVTSAATTAKLPARPQALTSSQYQALHSLQKAPDNASVLDVKATYAADSTAIEKTYSEPERQKRLRWTRFSDDALTLVYDVCWPGTYLAIIICAL